LWCSRTLCSCLFSSFNKWQKIKHVLKTLMRGGEVGEEKNCSCILRKNGVCYCLPRVSHSTHPHLGKLFSPRKNSLKSQSVRMNQLERELLLLLLSLLLLSVSDYTSSSEWWSLFVCIPWSNWSVGLMMHFHSNVYTSAAVELQEIWIVI